MNKTIAGVTSEFLGAFALMFAGGAAIIHTGGENLLAIALAHGLILGTTVSALMHISGGQFNPAVSIALGVIGKQPWSRAVQFTLAQLAGAVAAAVLLKWSFTPSEVQAVNLGATLGRMSTGDGANLLGVLTLETVATFFLMIVILGSAVDQRGVGKTSAVGGFAIGLVVSANILAIGPLTGASMNPCRSFGPALVGGHWAMHWAYWAAPVAGAVLAALAWKHLLADERA
ncbi:MAG TPA: aquaporin [Phycisphaerales bacterium]|nr:aquaporin [Phycisphaerales bacterium]